MVNKGRLQKMNILRHSVQRGHRDRNLTFFDVVPNTIRVYHGHFKEWSTIESLYNIIFPKTI